MILFAILVLVDFTVGNDLLFEYRIDIAGLPLNLLDALVALLFVRQAFRSRLNDFKTDRVHPLFIWSFALLVAAMMVGVMGSTMNGSTLREWITALRNQAMLPLCIFIGYNILRTPRHVRPITYIWLFGGVCSALGTLFLVRDTAEEVKWGKSFDELRAIRYGGDAGLTSMAFLAFALLSRVKVLPRLLMVALLLLCGASFFSLPHRGSYVVGIGILTYIALVLPRASIGRRVGMLFGGFAIMLVSMLLIGAVLSQMTGRDFKTYVINNRLKQLLPGYDLETKTTVLGTRLPGILAELQLWSESPVIGQGFAIGVTYEDQMGARGMGMNHNVWTSSLSQMGPLGLFGYAVPVIGCMIVGFRMWRDQTERDMAILGALGAITGVISFMWASLSMTINQQRLAILVGLMFGIVFRCRAMQLTVAREYAGYLEPGQMLDADGGTETEDYGNLAIGHGGPIHS